MHVLVIGGTRFVGYQLVWRLLAAGHRVTLLNRGRHPDRFGARVERLLADRTTDELQRVLAGREFDAAVDFVAFGAKDVRAAILALGDRVGHYVFISTGQVYLVRQGCPFPAAESGYEGPLIPEPADPYNHENWTYGVLKREAEDVLAEAWSVHRFPSTRLRLPMVNGERDPHRRVESYLWRILDGGPLLLPDGGAHLTRHVYSGDVARCIVRLLGQTSAFGAAYNLAQTEEVTLVELVGALAELCGAEPRLWAVSSEALRASGFRPHEVSPFSEAWMSRLDPSKAVAELGFTHEPLLGYLGRIVSCFLNYLPASPPPGYARREVERELASRAGFAL